ncbi:MAG: YlxR family protein [Clostridia bacterium]|nr:YlxR family protein [Clostridia bacterium]
MAAKKIPMRKCIGCNEMKEKRELIRVVRSPENEISLDLTGKKPGKGAYICHNVDCYKAAVKAKRFEKAFSCVIPIEVYEKMQQELEK